jgi:hypothetical protein
MAIYLGSEGAKLKGVVRVPDAVQRATLLRRAGTHACDDRWTPDQQRTAFALRSIRGTLER